MSELAGTVAEHDETVVKSTHIAAAAAFAAAAVGVLPLVGARAEEQRNEVSWRLRAMDFRASLDKGGQVQAAAFQPAAAQLKRLGLDVDSGDVGSIVELRRELEDGTGIVRTNFDAAAAKLAAERKCLAEAIYYEARSETSEGQQAVAEVIANRTRSKYYPGSICGVVYQGSNLKTGCQFSFTCDGSLRRQPHGAPWNRAQQVAMKVMTGQNRKVTSSATHYHTVNVMPVWSASLVETKRIGAHIFYRLPNSSERKAMSAAATMAAANDTREM
ncbi:MAG: cell wall hydrolase [Caulobacterales bacterium]